MNKKEMVLVVGASSEIGMEIIKQISDVNVRILAVDILVEKVERLKGVLPSEIVILKADISNENQIKALIDSVNIYGIPDKIVFCAAPKMRYVRLKELDWDLLHQNIDIQIKGPFLLLKDFLPRMAKDRNGKILFLISSVVLGIPPKFLLHYTLSKYALLGLMKSLASEFADKGITVNAISPSMTETSFLSDIPAKTIELSAEAHPLKRNASPKDIAPLAKFLLSEEANYINGVNVPVCGGSSA
jgi:3-oxoacyl-[acyl-carrier protein] reductase